MAAGGLTERPTRGVTSGPTRSSCDTFACCLLHSVESDGEAPEWALHYGFRASSSLCTGGGSGFLGSAVRLRFLRLPRRKRSATAARRAPARAAFPRSDHRLLPRVGKRQPARGAERR